MKKIILLIFIIVFQFPLFAYGGGLIVSGGHGTCYSTFGSEYATTVNAVDNDGDENSTASTDWSNSDMAIDGTDTNPSTNGGVHNFVGTADADLDRWYINWVSSYSVSADTFVRISWDGKVGTAANTFLFGYGWNNYQTLLRVTEASETYASHVIYVNARTGLDEDDSDQFIVREGNNTDDVYLDNFSIKAASLCYGSDLYTEASAVNPYNETDGTGSWGGEGTVSLTSEEDDPQNGTSYLAFTASGANEGFYLDLSSYCTNGVKYRIDHHIYNPSGDAVQYGMSDDHNSSVDAIAGYCGYTGDYTHHAYVFTYSDSYPYFFVKEAEANNDSHIHFDTFRLRQVLDE